MYDAVVVLLDLTPAVRPPGSAAIHGIAIGVVSMMLLGMGAKMLPMFEGVRLQAPRLMDSAFLLLNASVALRVGFLTLQSPVSQAMVAISGVAGLIAVVLFAAVVWRTFSPAARRRQRHAVAVTLGGPGRAHQTPSQPIIVNPGRPGSGAH